MAEVYCVICGQQVKGLFKDQCNEGYICRDCLAKCTPHVREDLRNMSVKQVKRNMTIQTEMLHRKEIFKRTRKINKLVIDETHRLWHVKGFSNAGLYYSYDDIVDYNVIKHDTQIIESHTETKDTGGLTRAIVGGMIFGATGAIVGSTTGGSKSVTTSTVKDAVDNLAIIIEVKDDIRPIVRIDLITSKTATDSYAYRAAINDADEIVRALRGMERTGESESKKIS